MATKTFPKAPIVVAFSRLLVDHVFRLEEGNPIDIDRFVDRHEAHKNRLARERGVAAAAAAAASASAASASASSSSSSSSAAAGSATQSIPAVPPPPPAVAAKQLAEKKEATRRSRFAGIGATF